MNFSTEYETTALHIQAIRRLSDSRLTRRKAYKLALVNFDSLKHISTSAALVLTAELSRWDDSIRQRLRPLIDSWDESILARFYELGFFDLFQNNPMRDYKLPDDRLNDVRFVRYIKGECGDNEKTQQLKDQISDVMGDQIKKWIFLNTGLSEAITNVSHHAYPDRTENVRKTWYLTGGYNSKAREFKIVFYDQGIGIPKSLPASEIWEKALEYLSLIPLADRKKDEVLLRAAVELDRTSTEETDRGKGIQDMLEFIRQRNNGYLSILSQRGLYKYAIENGVEKKKSEHFKHPIMGTLIIWKTALDS